MHWLIRHMCMYLHDLPVYHGWWMIPVRTPYSIRAEYYIQYMWAQVLCLVAVYGQCYAVKPCVTVDHRD